MSRRLSAAYVCTRRWGLVCVCVIVCVCVWVWLCGVFVCVHARIREEREWGREYTYINVSKRKHHHISFQRRNYFWIKSRWEGKRKKKSEHWSKSKSTFFSGVAVGRVGEVFAFFNVSFGFVTFLILLISFSTFIFVLFCIFFQLPFLWK